MIFNHIVLSKKVLHKRCLRCNRTLCIWSYYRWHVKCISFDVNIFHVSWCIDQPLSLECLNNVVELLIEWPWKMVVVVVFNCEILEWSLVINLHMIICNFLVVGIKATPLVFAHLPIAKDFQFCHIL
jgi:hypothetical protein